MATTFQKLLEKFDEDGRYAGCGKWTIGKGGYDLWWEIYYDNQCVLRCVASEVEVETAFNNCFTAKRRSKILHELMTWDNKLKFSDGRV